MINWENTCNAYHRQMLISLPYQNVLQISKKYTNNPMEKMIEINRKFTEKETLLIIKYQKKMLNFTHEKGNAN